MGELNQISFKLNEKEKEEVKNAINVLKNTLLPHLKKLSAVQRKELPKMGEKSVTFVQKALEYAQANPELIPTFVNVGEFKTDMEAFDTIHIIQQNLLQITDVLNDTMLLSGSEAYSAALFFYNSVKSAKRAKVPKAETIYNDLATRFPGKNRKVNNKNNREVNNAALM